MSIAPRPRQTAKASGLVLSVSRPGRARSFAIGPIALCLIALVLPLGLAAGAGLLYGQVFRDDVLEALLRRQADMQYAYEDRLAAMRAQVDRAVSRQLLDQNTLEGRVHDLLSRQAQLESRSAMITALAEQAGMTTQPASPMPPASARAPDALPIPSARPGATATPRPETSEKPRPEAMELRTSLESPDRAPLAAASNPDASVTLRMGALGRGLDRIDHDQVQALSRIGSAARRKSAELKAVIIEAGLTPESLSLPSSKAMGGPFIPLKADPNGSAFGQELSRIAADYQAASRLTQLVVTLPVRRPLAGRQEITSGFGPRLDPFIRRMALHTGVDLREDVGEPVRATGGGRVVSAGWSGGYGNMVEIDHGNGLSTRYGHMSAINVAEGQSIAVGAILGRVGSTGRSTGPHLHYEVRIDGEAVDPTRFLRASDKVAELR